MPLEHLLLPVQRLMVGPFRHDHLRQQARSRRALLDRLRRLGGGPHRAVAGVLQANVLNHLHRRGNVFVAFAGLFRDQPQVLAAAGAVLFRFRQIVNDSFPLQMPRQRLPPAALPGRRFVRFRGRSRIAIEIVVVLGASGFGFRAPRLPGRLEQRQLLFRQLLALAVALRLQQFAQQALVLVLLRQRTIQLLGQIHHDLPQRLCVPRQAVRIDGHRASRLPGKRPDSK